MKKSTFLIVGKHAVLEALKNPNRKIERVFLTEDAQRKLNRENQNLNLFRKINVFYKSKKELDNLCGRDETAHQGLVAEVEQQLNYAPKRYLIILVTTPAPTVFPPSLIAKFKFSFIAIGVINLTVNFPSSPGITISVPDGNVTSPVTSVVLK